MDDHQRHDTAQTRSAFNLPCKKLLKQGEIGHGRDVKGKKDRQSGASPEGGVCREKIFNAHHGNAPCFLLSSANLTGAGWFGQPCSGG